MMKRLSKTRPYRTAVGLLTLALTWTTFTPAHASVPDCEALARKAGLETDLPWELLPAIARVESGIDMGGGARTAWPWTLNEGGQSRYFKTQEEALAYLKDAVSRGVTNIDVGCMQINYRWHGDKFRTLADMLDPEQNTAYGALYLSNLNRHLDDWAAATARYHSSDPTRGSAYFQKVSVAQAELNRTTPALPGTGAGALMAMSDAPAMGSTLGDTRGGGVVSRGRGITAASALGALIHVPAGAVAKDPFADYPTLPDMPASGEGFHMAATPETDETRAIPEALMGRADMVRALQADFAAQPAGDSVNIVHTGVGGTTFGF